MAEEKMSGWMTPQVSPAALEDYIHLNREEYRDDYDLLIWISPDRAREAAEERESLLNALKPRISLSYSNTKPHLNALSPGCRACGGGTWSCLFINGICNARCFFCPSSQDSTDEPMTNTVTFSEPEDYVDYIGRMGFRGVSLSGGEPLVTFDRTLQFLRKIKQRFGSNIHLWLYTNGFSATPDKLRHLREAGLDEIRFNTIATGYGMASLHAAVGIVPTVTVEIPAIPEDEDRLRAAIGEMSDAGVHYLNLHQLRLTPHNLKHLRCRPYTYLHGTKVTVLESELTALRILNHAAERRLALPINYCSFVYKNRFQSAAVRQRNAGFVLEPWEDVTDTGFIRRLSVRRNGIANNRLVPYLRKKDPQSLLWRQEASPDRIFIQASLLKDAGIKGLQLSVSYFSVSIRPSASYRNAFRTIRLNANKSVVIERRMVMNDRIVSDSESRSLLTPLNREGANAGKRLPYPPDISPFEKVEEGLSTYF